MKKNSPFIEFKKSFFKKKGSVIAFYFLVLVAFVGIFYQFLAPYDPNMPNYAIALQFPSINHIAGTDGFGRDVFSRILAGIHISLFIGVLSVTIGMLFGVILGLLSGYYGGWFDTLVMRVSDFLFAFPGILLAIGIIAILGPGIFNVIISVSIFGIPTFARLVRGSTMSLKTSKYVEASKIMGASDFIIITRHIMPSTLSPVMVYASLRVGSAILTASSLSFLGLGVDPSLPEWGAMLAMSREYMIAGKWFLTFFPGLAIFLVVLAFNVLGEGVRDALDPKSRYK